MSDNDLIRRGDALYAIAGWEIPSTAIAALPAVTVGVRDFDVEVVRGNTGGNLALYFNDHRVAGSKPWGGGTPIHQFRVQGDDAKSAGILATIRDFQTVPVVKEGLTTDAALPAVTVGVPEAAVHRAVLDWIKDDAGAAVKMSMTPDRANALTARILAALEPQPAPDAVGVSEAADRIEALVEERDQWIEHTKNAVWADSEELKLANARAERLEAALREIESISVHSGGEVHGVTALQWELAFAQAQDVASSALSDVATASAALHRSFPEVGDGRPLPPMGDELMSAGLSAEDARFVAVQLAQNGYTLTKRED